MQFKILDIAFDFDEDYDITLDDCVYINSIYIDTVWDAEDDDDLVDQITNESGWCIEGISFVNISN
jgi:hypothetical protein